MGGMSLPITLPVQPMLAKAVTSVPEGDEFTYEPKWDGFRCIVARDGDDVELHSRGSKLLTRYFPELVEALKLALPERVVLDGEIVLRQGSPGHERLSWDALSARIHPAASRIEKLAAETPAQFVAFDLLAEGDDDVMGEPFEKRRARLEALFAQWPTSDSVYLTRTTRDADEARRWFEQFEGAGLDGVVAKPLDQPYAPGKRTLIKIKHARSADVVALGYRIHKSGSGVGSLLVGLYDVDGRLHQVGGVAAWSDKRRQELVDELAPLVERDEDGAAVTGESERSRFSGSKDVSFVRLRPERVLEVRYDQLEGDRFRHTVQFERWRPDRDARSCTYDQLDTVAGYDLADVIG